jgi:plasmid stabilization system protein ParE
MALYDLTPAAEADLLEIARYTLRQGGEQQQRHYGRLLESCFQGITKNTAPTRTADRNAHEP